MRLMNREKNCVKEAEGRGAQRLLARGFLPAEKAAPSPRRKKPAAPDPGRG